MHKEATVMTTTANALIHVFPSMEDAWSCDL